MERPENKNRWKETKKERKLINSLKIEINNLPLLH